MTRGLPKNRSGNQDQELLNDAGIKFGVAAGGDALLFRSPHRPTRKFPTKCGIGLPACPLCGGGNLHSW